MSFSHLTKETAKVLLALHELPSPNCKQVASLAGMKASNVSRALRSLENVGLVRSRKKRLIVFERIASLDKAVSLFDRKQLVNVLCGSTAQLVYAIGKEPSTLKAIQRKSGLSPATLKRELSWLLYSFPLLYRKKKGVYALNEQGKLVFDVIRAIESVAAKKLAETKGAIRELIIFPNECLFSSNAEPVAREETVPTGISVFGKFGIGLLSSGKNYFVYPRKKPVKIEEAVVHALCFDRSASTLLYCLLVISKNKMRLSRKKLLQKSEEYDLQKLAEKLLLFLETNGKEREAFFPSWEKFEEKRREYDA